MERCTLVVANIVHYARQHVTCIGKQKLANTSVANLGNESALQDTLQGAW